MLDTRTAALRAARICANRYRTAPRNPTPYQPGDVVRLGREFWAIRQVTPQGLLAWSFSMDARWPHTAPRDMRRQQVVWRWLRLVPEPTSPKGAAHVRP